MKKSEEIKVLFYTRAYNAEKTIRRTIDSVVNQTYSNWIYHILDNGSTDSTGEIIQEYEKKDVRIITHRNKQNNVFEKGNSAWEIMQTYDENNYICFIDADDEYKPDFLEKLCPFISDVNLDIAVGGNDFINATNGQLTFVRKLNDAMILENETFGTHFPVYHQFMRTWWGKLFKISVMRKINLKPAREVSHGRDTLFTAENFRNASRVGIYADSFYKYYVNPKTLSYNWDDKRISSDRIVHDSMINYLLDKVGFVSEENKEFLFLVYFNAIKDTLEVLINTQISDEKRIECYRDIFTSRQSQELAGFRFQKYQSSNEEKNELFEWFRRKFPAAGS